jgi:hypothetical protein
MHPGRADSRVLSNQPKLNTILRSRWMQCGRVTGLARGVTFLGAIKLPPLNQNLSLVLDQALQEKQVSSISYYPSRMGTALVVFADLRRGDR